jgi:hypothetical protein
VIHSRALTVHCLDKLCMLEDLVSKYCHAYVSQSTSQFVFVLWVVLAHMHFNLQCLLDSLLHTGVQYLRILFRRYPVWILAGTPTILIKLFRGFTQPFRANSRLHELCHEYFQILSQDVPYFFFLFIGWDTGISLDKSLWATQFVKQSEPRDMLYVVI